jgi:spore germination protein YaaH
MSLKQFSLCLALFIFFVPRAQANTSLEVSGWIPSWQSASGTAEALLHLKTFTEVNPFAYGVASDGTLIDALGVNKEPWTSFIRTAQSSGVRVVPTIAWSNSSAIDTVLESPTLRNAHIKAIVNMVYSNGFDGVDIDYENKSPQTETAFGIFMNDLYKAMGNKWVECDAEAENTADLNIYVNTCDRVKLMVYDERIIDRTLSTITASPYAPLADPKWVEAVVLADEKIIPKKKIEIGIATYGYEYQVTQLSSGYDYRLLDAFDPNYATTLATSLNITPTRNSAGELSFAYSPNPTSLHLLWWSDANAIADKVALAKSLGVRGVSIFKIDGGADQGIWNVLKESM